MGVRGTLETQQCMVCVGETDSGGFVWLPCCCPVLLGWRSCVSEARVGRHEALSRLLTLCVVCCVVAAASLLCCAVLQGLAEVLAVMGAAHLSELLPELAASATSKNPFVREGHLTLFRWV